MRSFCPMPLQVIGALSAAALALGAMACSPAAEDGSVANLPPNMIVEPGSTANVATPPAKPVAAVEVAPDPVASEEPLLEPPDAACVPGVAEGLDAAPGCELVPLGESKTKYPIVLAHGMGGFAEFGLLQYWAGVAEALASQGYPAYTAVVDPLNGSDVRAAQLAEHVDLVLACTCAEKVNLIGHSQGGIDSRVLTNTLGYADRVASITTLATPHLGSPLAPLLIDYVPSEADPLIDFVAWLVTEIYTDPEHETRFREAVLWVTEDFLVEYWAAHPDPEGVARYSFAGRAGLTASGKPDCEDAALPNPKEHNPISGLMLAPWTLIGGLSGVTNDGLVTVQSARWGEFRGCLPADHMQEIGLGLPQTFDHLAVFVAHAEFLAASGH